MEIILKIVKHIAECSATPDQVPSEVAEVSVVVNSSCAHAGPLYPIDVLFGLNMANGQTKVMSGCFGVAKTPD